MAAISKSDAQRRVDRIGQFRDELSALAAEGVLTLSDEQRRAVMAYHEGLVADLSADFDIDVGAREKQFTLGMNAQEAKTRLRVCFPGQR